MIQNNLLRQQQAVNYYALKDAVEARGIKPAIAKYIKLIEYTEFVELTEIYLVNQVW